MNTIGPGGINHHQDWPEQLTGTPSDEERLAKMRTTGNEILGLVRHAHLLLLDDQGEELFRVSMSPVRAGDTINYTIPTEVQVSVT